MLSAGEASGVAAATNLRVVENYINKQDGGSEILGAKHQNLDIGSGGGATSLAAKTRFYSDICMKDHVFGVQE